MFHSETIARVIHADRMRELERTARERRLLVPDDEPVVERIQPVLRGVATVPARTPCGDTTAGLPA
jgi:hypothetical protein